MGKSSLLRNILDDVTGRQGKRGLLFSFEMTRSEVGQAMIAASAEVNLQRIRNGKIRDDEWPKLAYVLGGHLDHTRLGICDRPYLRIEDIRADTRKFAAQGGIDLLAVDYLQLITGDDRYNPNEQIARISRGLKTLGMELNIPVIAVAWQFTGLNPEEMEGRITTGY
jgi:replicative DNA helicase